MNHENNIFKEYYLQQPETKPSRVSWNKEMSTDIKENLSIKIDARPTDKEVQYYKM